MQINPENTRLFYFENVDLARHIYTEQEGQGMNVYRRGNEEMYDALLEKGYPEICMGKIEDNPDEIEYFAQFIGQTVLTSFKTIDDSQELLETYAHMRLDGEIPLVRD